MRAAKKKQIIFESEKAIKDVLILENDLLRTELMDVSQNQMTVLEGANRLLHKIDLMRKFENKILEERNKQKYGQKKKRKKSKKNFKGKKSKKG